MKKVLSTLEIKKIQLEVLDKFISIADKHRLTYFLYYGSLLGAARHNGYIPWDDDIDIAMPREHYERLKKIDTTGFNISINSLENTPSYIYHFIKISDNNTLIEEEVDDEGFNGVGINIDIFPIDFIGKNHMVNAMRLKATSALILIRDIKLVKTKKTRGLLKNSLHLMGKTILKIVSLNKVNFLIDKICRTRKGKCCSCGVLAGTYGPNEIFNVELFKSSEYKMFEGRVLPIPIGWKAILHAIYGDYMALPPEENRITHHDYTAYLID